jgi:hypothetical protein
MIKNLLNETVTRKINGSFITFQPLEVREGPKELLFYDSFSIVEEKVVKPVKVNVAKKKSIKK